MSDDEVAVKKKSILDQVTVLEPEVNPRYARDAARLEMQAEFAKELGQNFQERAKASRAYPTSVDACIAALKSAIIKEIEERGEE